MTRVVKRKNERGNVLVYTVLSAFFLFMAVGLGVDLSHLYLVKAELQNAADAAALAGASALTLPAPDKIRTAVDRAVSTMNFNKYNFDNRTFAATNDTDPPLVTFAVNVDGPFVNATDAAADPEDIRFIKVNTPSVPVNTFFAIPFLGTSRSLNARATAGLSVPGNARYCPAPMSAVQCGPSDPACAFASQFWGNCGDAPIPGTPVTVMFLPPACPTHE